MGQPEVVDAHLHLGPGVEHHDRFARLNRLNNTLHGLLIDLDRNRVATGIVVATPGPGTENATAWNLVAQSANRLYVAASVDPTASLEADLAFIRTHRARVVGIKLVPGYRAYAPDDPICTPIYEFAERENLPVIVHCGDTATSNGKLKYTHPLALDDVATEHRKLNLVIAHFGNPWIRDTAELVYKNPNLYADTSGLVLGAAAYSQEYFRDLVAELSRAIHYIGSGDRVLYGSDWPFSRIDHSLRLVRRLNIHPEDRQRILGENARRLFRLN